MRVTAVILCGSLAVLDSQAQIFQPQGPSIQPITGGLSRSDADWQLRQRMQQAQPATPPQRQASNYERIALEYAEFVEEARRTGHSPLPAQAESFWQRRLDLADRVDRGQLSAEVANKLANAYFQEFLAVGEAKRDAQARLDEQLAQQQAQIQAQIQAQQQAQADAERSQRIQDLLDFSARMLAPRAPVPASTFPTNCSSYVNGRYISTRCF